ncbi:tRNA-queuosine alpha-mannosyltransferase domain-containing protein [Microbulbifer yueqingensis]|uniref:tRNA-queuosine alpha-mannosyltransferase n=1 Tax=Microbulbifer yueqingensis TaxID=658219 RepID=A0A1G8UQA8_9GAMM|nr:DUF3524 domain-containing protein [Microbulbifer yueqingensis]SDJ55968.1 Glycosyl transferases group 1 [Microbulbifer yueqingensis]
MRVLLLSAYDAASHRRWRKGLVAALPEWDWTVLTLPARYFSWRVRGNSLSWGRGEARELLGRPWDLVVATSMTDLSALRGLVPEIAGVPTAVYFHENQFAYPRSDRAHQSVEPQLLNIYTALCGDLLLFNSGFNRRTLLEGAERLLKRFPDFVPAGICAEIEARSHVLPVPLEDELFAPAGGEVAAQGAGPLEISWAARWEYDKGGARLLDILRGLEEDGVEYRLNLLGESFRNTPEEFSIIQHDFAHRLGRIGFLPERSQYLDTLRRSHVFLSTAHHEFQGLAVLEACALGCTPLVPDEQAYPDFYPAGVRYGSNGAAVEKIRRLASGQDLPAPQDVSGYAWRELGPVYRDRLYQLAAMS